jgi:hypothetical protein
VLIALLLALWAGLLALQLADIVITASRLPQLSAFASIRAELTDVAGQRLTTEQLEAYREQITALDVREAARAIPARRSTTEQLWRGTPWRLTPVVLALVPVFLLWPIWPYSLLALLLPVIAYVLALAAARASVAAASARALLHEAHRVEIEELLDRAARSSRKRVAGLGDRVTRALQILREQQD